MRKIIGLLLFSLALPGTGGPALAAESYANCTGFITSAPAVIATQGTWCLRQDIATGITSGIAISVTTNNVTIDCNDFKLGGLTAGVGTTAAGISGQARSNITVRHCNIRGFREGVNLNGDGVGHLVEDNRLDRNTLVGLRLQGNGTVVRRNLVSSTGGGAAFADVRGIQTIGSSDIIDNRVTGVSGQSNNGPAFGISALAGAGGRIKGNTVQDVLAGAANPAYAIFISGSEQVSVRRNSVSGTQAASSVGISCNSGSSILRDNFISGFPMYINVCTDGMDNVLVP